MERIISTAPTPEQRITQVEKRLENAYKWMVTSAKDFVERSIITAPEARTLLENALVPEDFYTDLGRVTVEVEVEMTATVTYTAHVEVTVDSDWDDDALTDALYDKSVDVAEYISDNISDAKWSDECWEVLGSEAL